MGLQQTDFIAGSPPNMLLFHVYHLRSDLTPDQIVDRVRLATRRWATRHHNFPDVNFDWREVSIHCREISKHCQEMDLVLIEVEIHPKYVSKLETVFDGKVALPRR